MIGTLDMLRGTVRKRGRGKISVEMKQYCGLKFNVAVNVETMYLFELTLLSYPCVLCTTFLPYNFFAVIP